jgi:cullin-4
MEPSLAQPPEYLGAVNKILQDEGERLVQYLDSTTRRPLVGVLEEQLIAAHQQTVLEKGTCPGPRFGKSRS